MSYQPRRPELGMRPLVAHCHLGLGKLYRRKGKRDQAQEHLTTATTMYREMDSLRCTLIERTEGNPLFLEESVRTLSRRSPSSGRWSSRRGTRCTSHPGRIERATLFPRLPVRACAICSPEFTFYGRRSSQKC